MCELIENKRQRERQGERERERQRERNGERIILFVGTASSRVGV